MGRSAFGFGRVVKHLLHIGVESMSWRKGELTALSPPEAKEDLHIDVYRELMGDADIAFGPLDKAIRNDPGALFKILADAPSIAGPWVKATKPGVSVGRGTWRCDPKGDSVVTVYPSRKLSRPEQWEFQLDYLEDDEDGGKSPAIDWDGLREAEAEYERVSAIWKPWTWTGAYWLPTIPEDRFFDTREEAEKAADTFLRNNNILIWNGE